MQLGTILIFHCSCLRKTNRSWYHCFQLLWWILPSLFLIYWMWNSESDNLFCSNWYLYTNCYYRGCHNPILPISSCEIVIGHKRSGFEEFFIYPCNIKSDACDYKICTIHKASLPYITFPIYSFLWLFSFFCFYVPYG